MTDLEKAAKAAGLDSGEMPKGYNPGDRCLMGAPFDLAAIDLGRPTFSLPPYGQSLAAEASTDDIDTVLEDMLAAGEETGLVAD